MVDPVCIEEAVAARSRIRGLAVRVEGSRVTLEGESPSFYLKQLAQEAAMPYVNGCELLNRIRVSCLETG